VGRAEEANWFNHEIKRGKDNQGESAAVKQIQKPGERAVIRGTKAK